jgi:hypothetical protein
VDTTHISSATRSVVSVTRRMVLRRLTSVVFAVGLWHGSDAVSARKRKKKKKKRSCRAILCGSGEVCKRGKCICPASSHVLECAATPNEIADGFCIPRAATLRVCCPPELIYAVCPTGSQSGGLCTAPESEAPSVCCPAAKACGNRCCEEPFTCTNAATSTCTGSPPNYGRLRRP